ncbi:hypothetical protein [Polaromonas sp.]|uniref:hypothetical protein n=1 Tax=Polaromonas sp. TaxID=1869339 RepID=UPI003569716B
MCGSSQPAAPTGQTLTQTTIPDYAKPYVEGMLGKQQALGDAAFNPFPGGVNAQVAGFSPLQQQAQSGVAGLQMPGQFGQASDMARQSGVGALGTTGQAAGYGAQGSAAGQAYGQNAQDPAAVQRYMNPYLQATLDPAMQLQQQQFGMLNAQNQGQATQAGAFGGGRQAIMQGLNQQNQMLAQNQLVGNAYNQAYNQANQNMQTAGSQAMQGAGLGLQGVAAEQAGYGQAGQAATNLSNIGNQALGAEQSIYGAQQATGATQQAQEQARMAQAQRNWDQEIAYPQQQLSNMSNMLRGLPMQGTGTQSTYETGPSGIQNIASLGLGAAGISRLMRNAKGGMIRSGGLGAIALKNLV